MLKSLKNIKKNKIFGYLSFDLGKAQYYVMYYDNQMGQSKKTARIKYARSFIIKSLTHKTIDIKYKIRKINKKRSKAFGSE